MPVTDVSASTRAKPASVSVSSAVSATAIQVPAELASASYRKCAKDVNVVNTAHTNAAASATPTTVTSVRTLFARRDFTV